MSSKYNIIINGNNNIVNINVPNEAPEDDLIERLREHKVKSRKISSMLYELYKDEKPIKADNIRYCGSYIKLREYKDEARTKHIKEANFCKHPLCPMCAWRYSLKWAVWLYKACQSYREKGYFLYHMILTRPNVDHITAETLREQRAARKKFFKGIFEDNLEAYAEAFEITCKGRGFHPHQHIIVVLKEKIAITREIIDILEHIWCEFMPSKYGYTILNLWPIKGEPRDVAEVCKYIVSPDGNFTKDEVAELDKALYQFKKIICNKSMQQAIKSARAATEEETKAVKEALEACGWRDFLLRWDIERSDYNISLLP